MADVLIDHVTKIYPGDVLAVDDVHIPIADGEFVVLVGPSGCGKSTTLRMVAGLEEITKGEISIGGRVVNDVPPKDRDIAMVFQNYALYPHMSVFKNMSFGLKLRKMPKAEIQQRIDNAAKILGIENLLDRKPKALSGGQRQRVALGRAIVRDPACFLFDEPLSNLDAKLRVQTRAELKALHHRLKTTTIYVTHDQEEAMTLGDRVVVMADTKVQQAADPLTVYNAPRNRFVAGFVGTPPMNFIDGRIESGGIDAQGMGSARFVGGGLDLAMDQERSSRLAGSVGQSVVLGLRPDGMHLRPTPEAPEHCKVEATVRVIEPLGGQMDLFCAVGSEHDSGSEFVARVKAEPMNAGSSQTLYVEPDKLHVFEPGEFGANLTLDQVTTAV